MVFSRSICFFKLQIAVNDCWGCLFIKWKYRLLLKCRNWAHLPEKYSCFFIPRPWAVPWGRKRDYFSTFNLQPDWCWIPNICENELNPSYLFPKWKPIWKIRPVCLCEAGERAEQILNPGKFFILDFFLSNAFTEGFFQQLSSLKRNHVKSLTNNHFTLCSSSRRAVMESCVIN